MSNKLTKVFDGMKNNPTLSVKEQLGYCGGIFGNCMGQDCVHTYSDQFCRNCMGIEPKYMTLKANITMILSFLIPPVAGGLYDRDRGTGKMSYVRMAIGSMPIPFAIASMLLFIVPFTDSFRNFVFALVFELVFNICDTFFDTAMGTLSLRMVPNPKDRKNFFTLTGLASSLGSALPGFVLPFFIDEKKDPSTIQWTYFYVALGFCIIGLAVMYSTFFCVKDKPVVSLGAAKEKDGRVHWNKYTVLAILRNRPFIVLQLATLSDSIRQVTYKSLSYLYKDTLDAYKIKPIFDAVSGSLAYAGLLTVPFLGSRLAPKMIVSGGYAYTGLMYLIMSLFNFGYSTESIRKKKYVIGTLIGLAGMPNYAMSAARDIIVADSTDYMEWYSAMRYGSPVRSDGILSAAKSLFKKFSDILTTNGFNILLNVIKYNSTNTKAGERPVQTDSTLHGIFLIVTLCGLIGNTVSSLIFLFDNYTGKRKEKILAELAEIRASRAETETV